MDTMIRNSAGLLWRHKRLVIWIFVVNFLLAMLSSLPARVTIGSVLGHSLAGARLVNGFDLGLFGLLLGQPEVAIGAAASALAASAVVFFVFLVFLDGGVYAVYLADAKLSRAEFFENCGLYFWRMLRLALYSLLPFGIVFGLGGALMKFGGHLAEDSAVEKMGFCANVAARVLMLLLLLCVRLSFDLAQARVVHGNERKVLRTALRSFRTAFSSGLYWKYLGIAAAGAVTCGAWVLLWLKTPHQAVFLTTLLLELVVLTQITVRLWLKATSARWVASNDASFVLAETLATTEAAPALASTLSAAPADEEAERPETD